MTSFLTLRRLRDYPRLIGAALWAAWGLEVLFRHGWQGGMLLNLYILFWAFRRLRHHEQG